MESMDAFFHDRVHNKKWFTARGLAALSRMTGLSPEAAAKITSVIILFWLMGQNAWIVCNSIAVIVPLLLTFAFPDERPPVDNMRVYWITAFVTSAYDRMLEVFPLYYVGKLLMLLFLLVEPSCLNERLKYMLKAAVESKRSVVDDEQESRKSDAVGDEQPAKTAQPPSSPGSAPRSPLTAVERSSEENTNVTSPGAPTPYDSNPLVNSKTVSSSSVDARASIAPAPPVGVGQKRKVPSTYIKLPKPVGKKNVTSVRVTPDERKSSAVPATSERKDISGVSTYFNLPK